MTPYPLTTRRVASCSHPHHHCRRVQWQWQQKACRTYSGENQFPCEYNTHTHTHMHTRTHTYTHSLTHLYTQAHARKYTHTQSHTTHTHATITKVLPVDRNRDRRQRVLRACSAVRVAMRARRLRAELDRVAQNEKIGHGTCMFLLLLSLSCCAQLDKRIRMTPSFVGFACCVWLFAVGHTAVLVEASWTAGG